MGEASDNELWRQAAAGDPAAFGALYERHARAIYNYFFRRCADWSLAEDLTSVAFLEAYRRRTSAAIEDDKVLPWLYGVATNILRNQRRSLRRHADALGRVPAPEPAASTEAVAAERVDAERRMRSVLAALDDLTKDELDVLALCVWSDLSYDDAAAALAIPVGTVRSRLSRARRRLVELSARHEPGLGLASNEGVCGS